MVAVLLMTGITLLGVATIWMIEHASHRGVAGWRLLLPFCAGEYIRSYWEDVRWFALARVLGLALMAAGVGVAVAKNPALLSQPSLIWQSTTSQVSEGSTEAGVSEFMATKEKALLAMRGDDKRDLSGLLHGQPFSYQRVELIGGVLNAREGKDFVPDLEVRILINLDPTGMTDRRSFYVQPTDRNPPRVFLSWRDAKGELQTRIIKHGYSLELQLAPLTEYRLNGFMQLVLPGQPDSYLSGNFIAETNHLRYSNGQVDIAYDDPDTLKYVARDYLLSRYRPEAVRSAVVENVNMDTDNSQGSASVRMLLSNDQLEVHQLKLQRGEFGWQVVSGSDQSTILRAGKVVDDTVAVATQTPSLPPKHIKPEELASQVGQTVTLTRTDGSTEVGVIQSFGKRGLQVEEQVNAGSVQYNLDPATISSVTLSSGQVLVLPAGQQPSSEAAATQAATASTDTATETQAPVAQPDAASTTAPVAAAGATSAPAAAASATPAPVSATANDFSRYRALQGKQVTVVGVDGKQRQGTLSAVVPEQLTLTVSMGAGSMQFFYKPGEVKSVTP